MSEPETPSKKDTTNISGAESPTTARPLDFDDDQQETGIVSQDGTSAPNVTAKTPPPRSTSRGVRFEEDTTPPPPKPPRPTDQKAENEATLIEAFPTIDTKVVRAVLMASGGQVEPAFNALLGMSDPDYQEETVQRPSQPRAQPQVPRQPQRPPQHLTQMEQDVLYARQLAEQYNSGPGGYVYHRGAPPQGQRQPAISPNREDRDYSFFDDELPEIQRNIKQGFLQTQTKVKKWISNFNKHMDGEDDEDPPALPGRPAGTVPQRQNYGASQAEQLRGIRKNADSTRIHGDRYDADPQVISDSFTELELRDEETGPSPPKKPSRPLANPDLFKPTPPPPPQSGPVDEVDAVTSQGPGNPNKSKKWQPLTSLAPAPDTEDNDPFSLGDSDDEGGNKSKDTNPEDTLRLKSSASNKEETENKSLEEKERSGSLGTRDKVAEELMKD